MNFVKTHNINALGLFILLQPAPVVLGLFTKRREC